MRMFARAPLAVAPLAVTMVAVALLAGAAAHGEGLHVWKHGIIEMKSDAGLVVMPLQNQFTAPYGLSIDIVNVQSDQVGLKALIAGQLDSYEGAPNSAIVAAGRGAGVKIVACAWPLLVQGIFVRNDVRDIADLRGRNVAISAPGSMPDLVMRAALKQSGTPPSEVTFASLGSDADRFKSLVAGIVSGAVVSSEFSTLAPPGIRMIKRLSDVYPQFLRGCIVTSDKQLATRHDDIVGLVAAEITGLHYALAHRDETIALTKRLTKAANDDPRAAFVFDQATSQHQIDPDMNLPIDKIEWMQDLLVQVGNVTRPVPADRLVDSAIRPAALSLARP